jgi:hypothetical protein
MKLLRATCLLASVLLPVITLADSDQLAMLGSSKATKGGGPHPFFGQYGFDTLFGKQCQNVNFFATWSMRIVAFQMVLAVFYIGQWRGKRDLDRQLQAHFDNEHVWFNKGSNVAHIRKCVHTKGPDGKPKKDMKDYKACELCIRIQAKETMGKYK